MTKAAQDALEHRRINERYAFQGHTPGPLYVRIPASNAQGDEAVDFALVPAQLAKDAQPLVIGEFFGRVEEEGENTYINARANADLAAVAFDPEIGAEASWRDLAQMREENVALRGFLARTASQLNAAMALNKDVLEELKLLTEFVNGRG